MVYSINRKVFFLIISFVLLYIPVFANEKEKGNQSIYKEIINGYKKAHKLKNTKLLKQLFCLDRVPKDIFNRIIKHLEKGYRREIDRVYVSEIDKD